MKALTVHSISYYAGRLTVAINGKRYTYEVSPYIAKKFEILLDYNKGRAIALLRGKEV